jgi:hypothetical protein
MAKVVHDSEAAPAGGPERVTVRLLDGTVLTEEIDGKPDLRDADAILEKYAVCAGRRLAEADVTALRLAVAGIDEIADISELLNLVKPDEG